MATAMVPTTPQRPLPGAFLTTPAPAPSIFTQNAQTLRQQPPAEQNGSPSTVTTVSPVERAAKTINETLAAEARFPALEDYVTQGVSADYELPKNPAWNPFQTLKTYDLPPRILEQANQGSLKMSMGLFAPLGHAWVAIDNCLYLWDYTMPNPTLIGFEENRHTIEAVALVTPKQGVFVKDITQLIVVATTVEMLLLGVAPSTTSTGAKTLTLYTTRMSITTRGLGVKTVVGTKTGRIFFVGSFSDDIYEFTYQPEEGWFTGRTQRITQTKSGMPFVDSNFKAVAQIFAPGQRAPTITQLVIDDTRNLMYSLSQRSEIKVWLIRDSLSLALSRPLASLLQSTGHFSSRTELLAGKDVYIASLSLIPATEATKVGLVATTSTGCRLYISLTRGYGYQADAQNAPTNMQILHIRFPPTDPNAPPVSRGPAGQTFGNPQPASGTVDNASRALEGTIMAHRLPPGYSLLFIDDKERRGKDMVFCTAPDTGRLKNPQDTSALNTRFTEFGQWMQLPSLFNQMQPLTADFSASGTPVGFGNELAVQFDKPSVELGIMTTSGIQTIRRRRLVDIFAALMRFASADEEGIEGDIKRFIRTYGRGETAATALAVACGQGQEVTPDSRVASVTDPGVLERARTVFIEHGGRPEYNANAAMDGGNPIDNVRPSPRHEGLALYISRLMRSIWRAPIVQQVQKPGESPVVVSSVPLPKLRDTQKDLSELQRFLENNRSFIEGLSGPQALGRVSSRQDEISLQGEHRAMNSLLQLISNIIEGISFALVLFDERVEEILLSLPEESRQRVRDLTYEGLFVSRTGRDLAKELVKAIVNRNIANGSNVDTVAEALRRRCGSFCSADDVVTFKAQEQVKKAQEIGAQTETGRALLNESQRLFQKVAASLSMEHLHWAIRQYVTAQFWAGAIVLCLAVAQEKDRANRAPGWVRDGMPVGDERKSAFDARKSCYDLIFEVIQAINDATASTPDAVDGLYTVSIKRRNEAQEVINDSGDTVFQTCLYDWYLSIGQADRLLDISSPFVVEYLRRRGQDDRAAADLLWRYFAHGNDYLEAAAVQLRLAGAYFQLSLEERIGYLGRARINASTRHAALIESKQSKQQLLREISDLLEVANIQDDILQRIKSDPRISTERRPEVTAKLNDRILDVAELFNQYADQASYHDICILIYQVADHRNPADIRASWQALIEQTDREAHALHGRDAAPWEAVGNKVRELGLRLNVADATFPVATLMPMLERYAVEPRAQRPPPTWAVDVFLNLDVPHETLLQVAERMFYSNEQPFVGIKRRVIAGHIVYLTDRWMKDSVRKGERVVFGNEETAAQVLDLLEGLIRGDSLAGKEKEEAELVLNGARRSLR